MDAVDNRFAVELETFEAHRLDWVAQGHDRHGVAVRGAEVLGPFLTPAQAWTAGVERWEGPVFMMRRVTREVGPVVVSHLNLSPEPPK
jgi:hypothetical protein